MSSPADRGVQSLTGNVVGNSDDEKSCNAGAGRNGPVGEERDEENLATTFLQIHSKRFYLDVKQNHRGRFIKLAEIRSSENRSRMTFSMSTARDLRNQLTEFCRFLPTIGPIDLSFSPDSVLLANCVLSDESRRYYLDLRENSRGGYLRLTRVHDPRLGAKKENSQFSLKRTEQIEGGTRKIVIQSIPRPLGDSRVTMVIPAIGISTVRDAITDLLVEFGHFDGDFVGELPGSKGIRVEDKCFFFDLNQNERGVFLKISEVKNISRSSISIPERAWPQTRDAFLTIIQQMSESRRIVGVGDDVNHREVAAPNEAPPEIFDIVGHGWRNDDASRRHGL